MDRPSPREERSTDEIDLRIVFRKLGNYVQLGVRKAKETFQFILDRWPYFVGITLLGIGLGYMEFNSKRPFFRSSMTIAPIEVRNEFFEGQVGRLSKLVIDGNHALVAADLKISEENAGGIKSITYSNINQNLIKEDSILIGVPFRIDVELYNNKLFGVIREGLKNYLEENPYFFKSTKTRQEQLSKVISKLGVDIAAIDSVKKSAAKLQGPANGFVYGEPLDPTNLFKQSVDLLERQAFLEAQLKGMETVQVVVDFTPLNNPTGPKLSHHLMMGAILSFLAAFAVALVYEKKKRPKTQVLATVGS